MINLQELISSAMQGNIEKIVATVQKEYSAWQDGEYDAAIEQIKDKLTQWGVDTVAVETAITTASSAVKVDTLNTILSERETIENLMQQIAELNTTLLELKKKYAASLNASVLSPGNYYQYTDGFKTFVFKYLDGFVTEDNKYTGPIFQVVQTVLGTSLGYVRKGALNLSNITAKVSEITKAEFTEMVNDYLKEINAVLPESV